MEEKIVQVKLINYKITGVIKFEDFYSNIGYIQMDDIFVDNIEKTDEEWLKLLNDSSFNSKHIIGGYVRVFEIYTLEMFKHINTMFIGGFTNEDLSKVEVK